MTINFCLFEIKDFLIQNFLIIPNKTKNYKLLDMKNKIFLVFFLKKYFYLKFSTHIQ